MRADHGPLVDRSDSSHPGKRTTLASYHGSDVKSSLGWRPALAMADRFFHSFREQAGSLQLCARRVRLFFTASRTSGTSTGWATSLPRLIPSSWTGLVRHHKDFLCGP